MNEEKTKNIILTVFIGLILVGSIFAIIFTVKPTVTGLRSNSFDDMNKLENASQIKSNNNAENKESDIEQNSLIDEMNIDENTVKEITERQQTFDTEVAKYSTTIYDTEENRMHNIKLACEKLNDTVIKSGDEFSFNDTIGPMDLNSGYKKATGFNGNGKKIKISAGGMCQISSTIYNVALIAGFEITERHAHSTRVYYVPKDKDATVSYGGANLKFINNTDYDVKISATTDGHDVTITMFK